MEEEQSRFSCATGGSGTEKILHRRRNGKGSPLDSTLLSDLFALGSEIFVGLKRVSCLFRSLLISRQTFGQSIHVFACRPSTRGTVSRWEKIAGFSESTKSVT